MDIQYGPGAKQKLFAPQFNWQGVNEDFQFCLVAGFELIAIKGFESQASYEMLYCNYCVKGISSMEEARALAPEFTKRVLLKLAQSIQVSQLHENDQCELDDVIEWRHKRTGNLYRMLLIANEHATRENYPVTVAYQGSDGKVWCRPLAKWHNAMEPHINSTETATLKD